MALVSAGKLDPLTKPPSADVGPPTITTTNKPKDFLTVLPLDVLLEIIRRVPLISFTALSHTSSAFHHVIKQHATTICNASVEAKLKDYKVADVLGVIKVDKWLVPTSAVIQQAEDALMNNLSHTELGEAESNLCLRVTTPGPQFLLMLEHPNQDVQLNHYRLMVKKASCVGMERFRTQTWFREYVLAPPLLHLQLCSADQGQNVEIRPRMKELIWFYGAGETSRG